MAYGGQDITDQMADLGLEDDVSFDEENMYMDDIVEELKPYLGRLALTKDNRETLHEILKCAVCLEVPMLRQVKVCEKGHHFCNSCHKKLTTCAICRGKLLNGRNFVVEELITKLGKPFGLQRLSPYKQAPLMYPKGLLKCPYHNCPMRMSALKILTHFRHEHASELRENLSSNPYTGWFQMAFSVIYKPDERQVYSFQVCDIGLLSLVLVFPKDGNFRAWIQMPRKEDSPPITYRIQISNEGSRLANGTLDVPVLSYNDALSASNNITTVFSSHLLPVPNADLAISFLVSQPACAPIPTTWASLWNEQMIFISRKSARSSVARNRRRKKLRAKKQELQRAQNQNQVPTENAHACGCLPSL